MHRRLNIIVPFLALASIVLPGNISDSILVMDTSKSIVQFFILTPVFPHPDTDQVPMVYAELPDDLTFPESIENDSDNFSADNPNIRQAFINLQEYKCSHYSRFKNAGLNNTKFFFIISDLPPPFLHI